MKFHFKNIPLTVGVGAGVGTIQVLLTKYYDRPLIEQIPAPWGNLSTLFNILTGGIVLGLGATGKLGKIVKNRKMQDFLIPYGFATLFGGIINGLLTPAPVSSRVTSRAYANGNKGYGPTPYMGEHVGFQNHMAKGFGAQYANPASTIPYNVILY